MLILVAGYRWEGKRRRGRREKSTTWFISFSNCLLLKAIWEHSLSSVNGMWLTETTGASTSDLTSQPNTAAASQWLLTSLSILETTGLQNIISLEHDLTQLFSWLLEQTSSASPTMSFPFQSRPIAQPSFCIFMYLQNHTFIQDVLQASEVNGIHCDLPLFLTATAHKGGVSQRTNWCLLEFAFKITLYNEEC